MTCDVNKVDAIVELPNEMHGNMQCLSLWKPEKTLFKLNVKF